MRKSLFLVFLILVFSSSLICLSNASTKNATNFSLQDLKGRFVTLENYRDKQSVALFFWTTWCPFCRQELKAINDMYPQLRKEGLEVLAIDVGESLQIVERFLQKYALFLPVILDKDTYVAKDYQVMGVPTVILVNKKGSIVYEGNYFPRGTYKKLINK